MFKRLILICRFPLDALHYGVWIFEQGIFSGENLLNTRMDTYISGGYNRGRIIREDVRSLPTTIYFGQPEED